MWLGASMVAGTWLEMSDRPVTSLALPATVQAESSAVAKISIGPVQTGIWKMLAKYLHIYPPTATELSLL